MTGSPLVQLYCKKLAPSNLDGFLHAEPDHVGWQVNVAKASHDDLLRAAEAGAAMTRRLSSLGIISVFLLHPGTDAARMMALLDALRPDIFLASAERDVGTLMAVKASGLVGGVMVPVWHTGRAEFAHDIRPRRGSEALRSRSRLVHDRHHHRGGHTRQVRVLGPNERLARSSSRRRCRCEAGCGSRGIHPWQRCRPLADMSARRLRRAHLRVHGWPARQGQIMRFRHRRPRAVVSLSIPMSDFVQVQGGRCANSRRTVTAGIGKAMKNAF